MSNTYEVKYPIEELHEKTGIDIGVLTPLADKNGEITVGYVNWE